MIKSCEDIPKILNGMHADEYLNNAWMELGDVRTLDIKNEMTGPEWEDENNTTNLIARTCRDSKYLHFFCKYVLNIDLLPFQGVMLDMLWHKTLPMTIASRGASKTFMNAVYCICRAVLSQGCKIVVAGASLRQSLLIYNYIETIWNNSPILRDICGGKSNCPKRDIHMAHWTVGESKVMFLPLGQGDKIRGVRANVILVDEFSSIPNEIFETVIRGFAAVKTDGLFGNVTKAYKEEVAKKYGFYEAGIASDLGDGSIMSNNQIVISGTAYFQFNHFYKYFKQYCAIIETGGDRHELKRRFPDMVITKDIDPKDYCILRLPYTAIPLGMMDEKILTQGRATMDPIIFDMEYAGIFPSESDGFFLATVVNAATCPVTTKGGIIDVKPTLFGKRDRQHILGIDPASEDDNFTINIIEMYEGYRVVVYQWSSNRKEFERLEKAGILDDSIKDYNTFCVKQIRSLILRFNVVLIVMDEGGGGVSVREGLKDPSKFMRSTDEVILDMDDEANKDKSGSKILKMINFSDYEFRMKSHYGLRKDMMDKVLLFPSYDPADVEESRYNAEVAGQVYDKLDDCYLEILECKNEMILIKHESTSSGKERWDVPSIKGIDDTNSKKRLKKDRFTSLLLANWGWRLMFDKDPVNNSCAEFASVRRGTVAAKPPSGNPVKIYNSIPGPGGRRICF